MLKVFLVRVEKRSAPDPGAKRSMACTFVLKYAVWAHIYLKLPHENIYFLEMGLQIFFSRAHPQNIGDVFAALCRRSFIRIWRNRSCGR
jgi:hypothetical protein